MAASKRVFAVAIILTCTAGMAIPAAAQLLQQPQPLLHHTDARELPPEMTRRFSNFHAALQPSARVWVEQQAGTQAQKGAPDVPGLESAIRSRFSQLNGGGMLGGSRGPSNDVEELAFVVMMNATQDMDQDLKSIMGQVNSINQAKESLRSIQLTTQKELAPSDGKAHAPCRSQFCLSLAERLSQLSASTPSLQRPVHLQAPAEPTYADLQVLQNSLKSQLDSMSEMGQTESPACKWPWINGPSSSKRFPTL